MKKVTPPLPKTKEGILEFINGLTDEEAAQLFERIVLKKKPKKASKVKDDLLCWQCEHARLNTCPHTSSRGAPKNGVQSCAEWLTSASIEYGDSPAKKCALKNL